MGRFSSSQQIYNAESLTKAQFKKMFGSALRQKGYAVCDEDSAEISYTLIFSKDRKWVSVLNPEYQPGAENVLKDAGSFAEALKTNVVSVGLVDSDFAELKLFDSSGKLADTLILGESYMDEPSPTGKKELWQPLLTENGTWEQVTEIQNGSYIFAEDALESFAQLIGMDGEQIMLDNEDTDDSAMVIYFKKAGEKKLTLNGAFKQVFGEALEPLGFKMIKGRQPYFVRVVGDEILHIITYRNESADYITQKSFNILGGVITVYRDNIDLTLSPIMNLNWLESNLTLYRIDNTEYDKDSLKIYKFSYESENINSMFCELKRALKVTTEIMLPMITSAVDIDSCINYFLKTGKVTGLDERFEGLIFLKTENYSKLIEANIKRHRAIYKRNVELKKRGYTQEEYEKRCQRHGAVLKRETAPIENILSTPELYEKYNEELKHRKMINLAKIISYGINIKKKGRFYNDD